jgi:major membrane immunogen (membrane-anchored lipoprotein)
LLQGTYQFELKVTDDKGAIGKDTVQVKVDSASNISIPAQGNVAPTANAGKDQTITLPTNSVTLSGSGNDSDGTIVSYFWTKISGPSSFVISNAGLSSTGVTGLIEGTYQFELKVTDDKGAIGKDTVQIKVNQAVISTPETGNVLPVVNAGADITITLPTNSTILSGTASDSDGTIASYSWTKISGPASFSLINSSSATANVTGLVAGTYQFELKVTDDKGGARKDSVQVIVLNGTNTSPTLQENSAPTANAGGDQTITLPTNSITLSGSGTDTDGTIASYSWTKISGPASFSVVASSSAATDITGLIEGIYQFELRVTDDKGAIGKDTVQIKVDSAINDTPVKGNIAPTADAGSDITTVSSTKFITLSGSGNDSDGKIISYLWTQISGPSGTVISASNAPTTKVRNLQEGTYEFELKVTDDQGAVATDTVKVTVALERTSTDNVTVKSTSLKVYPNPVHDVTTLEVTAPRINTNIMIVISNINGKTVYTKEFVSNSTYVTQQIDMSNLIKGSYIISVYFDGMHQQSIKVMKL